MTGLGATDAEKAAELEAYQHRTCEKWKAELMTRSQQICVFVVNPMS
jgi:mitochondrial inner membrane protease ATP23